MNVSEALQSRISCRAFLSKPVPEDTLKAILAGAAQAPSGGNLQPWWVYGLTGSALEALRVDVHERMQESPRGDGLEYEIYPPDLKEPYTARRFKCGEDLYASIDIAREDKPGRIEQFKRNFDFFGAPVGLFLYLDRTMGPPQWADCGMFLQSVMLLAREHGLHTCAQESWAQWYATIARHIDPPEELLLFCGLALGYMDEQAPVNRLRTERAGIDEFATLVGFQAN